MPTVCEWFTRLTDGFRNGANGDDRHLKASSLARIQNVHDKWLRYLERLEVNLADAPLNRIGPDEVQGFLAAGKVHGV